MKIALYQGPGHINNIPAAFGHMEARAREAKAQGADLLILPEMYLSGYNIGPEAALAQAMTAEGLAPARQIARETGIALVFGYPEKVGAQVANSAVLIGPEGDLLLNYRKTHLFGDLDRAMFKAVGDAFPVAELGGFKIGLLICYDIEFPEPARRLALAGAEILLIPTAQMQPYEQVARHVLPARAYENQVYTAYANHSGDDDGLSYVGLSSLCGPDGTVLAMAGRGEEMLYAEASHAHLAAVRAADPFFTDRRPVLYGPLAQPK
ncbi:carbon-nitrogen hydrolase family protein [Acidocella sp. KAb 2-4]|uniref:carbon-nitrogen hydrolase family protein n=1 Tax=Acidocella sp. KAb 2-4 TaxID=2885158 RepID=UPI001D080813|nr:carbon-nitrogen hydrolase family protein [Acidocella sp. KAb 2-4]MCB5945743.1 carbon-nitrogen hydrolase family protein [Acidocella sp. KAb 2-4]